MHGFQHGFPPFSDCSLDFTHVVGTLSYGSAVTLLYSFIFVSFGGRGLSAHHAPHRGGPTGHGVLGIYLVPHLALPIGSLV